MVVFKTQPLWNYIIVVIFVNQFLDISLVLIVIFVLSVVILQRCAFPFISSVIRSNRYICCNIVLICLLYICKNLMNGSFLAFRWQSKWHKHVPRCWQFLESMSIVLCTASRLLFIILLYCFVKFCLLNSIALLSIIKYFIIKWFDETTSHRVSIICSMVMWLIGIYSVFIMVIFTKSHLNRLIIHCFVAVQKLCFWRNKYVAFMFH